MLIDIVELFGNIVFIKSIIVIVWSIGFVCFLSIALELEYEGIGDYFCIVFISVFGTLAGVGTLCVLLGFCFCLINGIAFLIS